MRGYPGDKPTATMWTMSGPVYSNTTYPRQLWYPMDTAGGQSGSPVYHIFNGSCCFGVGIHAYGSWNWTGTSALCTSGARISQSVFTNMVNRKNCVYP